MEDQANNNTSSNPKLSETPVLNISGKVEPSQKSPRAMGKKKADPAPPVVLDIPKINPTTFPVIMGRILLKSNDLPAPVSKMNTSDFRQYLCLLCMEKPSKRKLVSHMFISNEKELDSDFLKVRKIYENRKDIKILEQVTVYTLCARSLFHRVQKKLTDVEWNKQQNIFETDRVGERDVWNITSRLYDLENQETEKLFNYAKFLSATNS
ncbi:uncharacterized protein LOC119549345 [Drosophila subpulchrella]|uniref:uncharacterized protein LOC119549345 n=1 Tax=Drosophila subpulchrella TaxID=1486046 RepID=UPI0018A13930|nr:uncharacterized protein LOC119549345 [Drosophila subpulchrella]